MNIHEYQAKKLFRDIGLSVPAGEVARSAEEAAQIYQKMGNKRVVVKAQVHAGGRGKAGGVKIVDTKEDLDVAVKSMVGKRLVTYQTDEKGQPVNQVLLEEPCEIAEELYLGAVVDRAKTKVVFMLSTEGGVEIEKVAEETPEKIFYIAVDPAVGMMPYQVREVGFKLGLNKLQVRQLLDILSKLSKAFQDLQGALHIS